MNEQHDIARFVVRQGLLTSPEAEQALEQCQEVPLLDWLQQRGWLTPHQADGLDELRRLAFASSAPHEQRTEDAPGRPVAVARADTPPPAALDSTQSSDPLRALFGLPKDDRPRRGRFVLEEETPRGRGGMGQVWLAHDHGLGRRVALKEMRPDLAEQLEAHRRFLLEAQVTSQLQHPGIVPVYEMLQSEQGPFYTMRFVEGRTLAQAIADYHRQPTPSALHDLLGVFVQVCNTLAYSHSRGVVHRDLKPANVVLGSFGEVVVLDWGLALVLASRERQRPEKVSRMRELPDEASRERERPEVSPLVWVDDPVMSKAAGGTPGYMAPEQARGEIERIDERADVFGLGAILCEILTGQPPFAGKSGAAMLQSQKGELSEALALLDGCGEHVELIALAKRCLSPQPEDRPRDAAAVAGAAAAYLAGVAARLRQAELDGAEARTRAAEEAKRRRLTLALAGTVLLGLTLGGGGWLWRKAERNAQQAQQSRDVTEAVNGATLSRERAKTAAGGGAALFAQARELAQRAQALVESGPADAALLVQVRQLRAELDDEEKDRRLLAALDAASLAGAETLSLVNQFAMERMVPQFREAFAAYGLEAGQSEPAEAAARLRRGPAAVREAAVAALNEWAELAANPKLDVREPHRAWLDAVAEAAEPADSWSRQFRAARAERSPARRRSALLKLAGARDAPGLPSPSLRALVKQLQEAGLADSARRLQRRAQRERPADFWVNEDLGRALRSARPPEPAEAVRYLSVAVALRPDSPGALINLGAALKDKGEVDEAIACHRKAIALDPQYAAAHYNLGYALMDKGELDEAIACYRQAVALDPKYTSAHINLGVALWDKGQKDEAIASYRKAVSLAPRYAPAHNNLGYALKDRGELDEAIACYRKAVALDPKYPEAHHGLGAILSNVKHDYDGAILCYRRVVKLTPKDANAHINLCVALLHKHRLDEADAHYLVAIILDPKLEAAHYKTLAAAHYNVGLALQAKNKLDEAIACYHEAIGFDPNFAAAYINLGNALHSKGLRDEAFASYRKAVALDPKDANAHYNLGAALRAKGELDEAIACLRRAVALDAKDAYAHGELGLSLLGTGRYAESRDVLARCLELLPAKHPMRAVLSPVMQSFPRLVLLEKRLPGLLRGEGQAASAGEGVVLAQMCRLKRLHAASARFAAAAFAADPRLAADLDAAHRYNAACSAALATVGQGEDANTLSKTDRLALRRQALTWLRADLAARQKQRKSMWPGEAEKARAALRHWQMDADLASLRDAEMLNKLAPEEEQACRRLWADVAAMLKKAEVSAKKEPQR